MLAQNFGDIQRFALPEFKFSDSTIGGMVSSFLPYIFALAGIGLLLYLLYGGFHLMISRGDPKAIQEAKGKITNALVGFLIVFVAYWIVQLVGLLLGVPAITEIFK